MIKRLILADMHFGSGEDLLRAEEVLERLEPELQWAEEVVIVGDLFELVFASLAEAVAASKPFLDKVSQHVGRIYYTPGNHDHHLVSLASDERRVAQAAQLPQPPAFTVAPAERLLKALCPEVDIVTAYPIFELDGIRFIHGHYMAPHIESFGWRMFDRLAWALTGEHRRQEELSVEDYEALLSPLYELLYEMANLPQGKRAQQQWERWLLVMGAVAKAPINASQQVVGFAHNLVHRSEEQELLEPLNFPTSAILRAMETVCANLHVPPGKIVFAHTHVPLEGSMSPKGEYEFYNCGSWFWDKRIRDHPTYRDHAWPGTVLRATGGEMEMRSLLEDFDEKKLQVLLGDIPKPKHRRRGKMRALFSI